MTTFVLVCGGLIVCLITDVFRPPLDPAYPFRIAITISVAALRRAVRRSIFCIIAMTVFGVLAEIVIPSVPRLPWMTIALKSFGYGVAFVGMATFGIAAEGVLAHLLVRRFSSRRGLSSSPGWCLHRMARWVFSSRTVAEVLEPVLSDMQVDFTEALAEGRPHKARWVRLRGYLYFWSHVVLQIPVDITRIVVMLWRIGR